MPLDLPPQFKQHIEERIPQLRGQLRAHVEKVQVFLGPLWAEFGPQIQGLWATFKKALAKPSTVGAGALGGVVAQTMGGQFRHILVVGLNKAELLVQHEAQPVWNDSWQELMDDTMKRHLGLVFFAPRGLDGRPVDALPFLMGEEEGAIVSQTPTILQNVALLDFCRLPAAAPNTVNMLAAADCLFHWDVKDTYVLPTNQTGWARDVEQVLRGYPRTTRANIYTQWDTALLPQTERITSHSLRALPLHSEAWLNEPTMQEKYGNHMLALGLLVTGVIWAGLWWQGRGVTELTSQLDMVQQQIPRGGQFSDLERAVTEQEKQFARRPLFTLAVKDAHRAVQQTEMQLEQLELKVPDVNQVPESYVLTLTMPGDAYSGWLQQEPVARAFLLNTALVHAVRKPPSTAGFKLEGLIMLAPWLREYKRLLPQLPSNMVNTASISATSQPVADEEGAE